MITGNHVREELEKATKVVNSIKEASLEAIIKLQKLIVKLLTVIIKITISNRSNTKKIMDKLDIPELQGKSIKPDIEFAGGSLVMKEKTNVIAINKIDIGQHIIDNINKGEQL